MVCLRVLVVSVLCVSSTVLAQGDPPAPPADPVATAKQKYTEASETFSLGEYAAAIKTIEEGLAVAPQDLPLLKLRGEVLLQKRDFEGALAAYEAFLDAKPRGANKRKAKKIVVDLASVRTTFLKVTVTGGSAEIYIDAKSLGVYCVANPECRRGVLPGRYRLFIERDGFFPLIENVEVVLNAETAIEKTLREKPSQASITVTPADAQVTLDGAVLGVGPQALEVVAGPHEVSASLQGFVTHIEKVSAHGGEPLRVALSLAELVSVTASVADAALTLDGQAVTLDAGKLVVPSDGADHTLVAKAEGFVDATVVIAAQRERGVGVEIVLEALAPAVVEKPIIETPLPPPGPDKRQRLHRTAAVGVGVLGAGLAVVGTLFALDARSAHEQSKDFCDPNNFCDTRGLDLIDEARQSARRADLSFAFAGAAAVGAVVWWIVAPETQTEAPGGGAPAVGVGPSPDGNGIGLSLSGGF